MNDISWTSRIAAEPITPIQVTGTAPSPAIVPSDFGALARRRWHEGLTAGKGSLATLRPIVRAGLRDAAERTADLARSTRDRTAETVASARLAILDGPERLREGFAHAMDLAGFRPLRLLLVRHPGLALALAIPVLIASLFLAFWGGVSAALLGLWCVTMSLIFANHAAHGIPGNDANSTTNSTRETIG